MARTHPDQLEVRVIATLKALAKKWCQRYPADRVATTDLMNRLGSLGRKLGYESTKEVTMTRFPFTRVW
jgi:hypothetical protein